LPTVLRLRSADTETAALSAKTAGTHKAAITELETSRNAAMADAIGAIKWKYLRGEAGLMASQCSTNPLSFGAPPLFTCRQVKG
jgi:hypothetical protein